MADTRQKDRYEGPSRRHLPWEGCFNARDLGGFPVAGGGETRWGAVVRSDNPCRLTESGRTALKGYGVRTVVDLRDPTEVEADPLNADGLACAWVPVLDFADAKFWDSIRGASRARFYVAALERFAGRFAAAVAAVGEAAEGTVLVHCQVGRDRTGLVVALLLSLAGVAPEHVADDYAQSAERLRPLYDRWAAEALEDESERLLHENVSPAETMLELLGELERRCGGAEAYLRTAGATPTQLRLARARLSAA